MHFVKAKGIISSGGGRTVMNVYRGCSHGCIYCDARSTCYGFTHAFHDIEVKSNAPDLLDECLSRKRKKCMIATGAMCDPYMHCEQKLQLTRKCLEVILRYGFGASVLTKSDLVLRDTDILGQINRRAKCVVQVTLTTFDERLCKILEPNVCTTKRRIEVLKIMQAQQIPTVVWLSPILPFINDTEDNLRAVLDACIDASVKGIVCFGMMLTLRDGDRQYFYAALDKHFPGMRQKYCQTYGNAYELVSPNAAALTAQFEKTCAANGILYKIEDCFAYLDSFPADESPGLF